MAIPVPVREDIQVPLVQQTSTNVPLTPVCMDDAL